MATTTPHEQQLQRGLAQDATQNHPQQTSFKALAVASGVMMVACSLLVTISFLLLRKYFGYPEAIRASPGTLLPKLHEMRHLVPYLFYSGVGAAGLIAFFPAPLLDKVFARAGDDIWAHMAKYCAMAFGLCLYAGILRWTFLFPMLAAYRVEGVYDAKAIDLVYEAFHTYVGETVAEHVGFTFMVCWLLFLSAAILKTRLLSKWIAFAGVAIAVVIFYGNLEFFNAPGAFWANREGVDAVGVWILALGISLLLVRNKALPLTQQPSAR